MLQDVANGIAEKQYAKNMEVAMLKITLKPGQYVNIGDDIRVVFALLPKPTTSRLSLSSA